MEEQTPFNRHPSLSAGLLLLDDLCICGNRFGNKLKMFCNSIIAWRIPNSSLTTGFALLAATLLLILALVLILGVVILGAEVLIQQRTLETFGFRNVVKRTILSTDTAYEDLHLLPMALDFQKRQVDMAFDS
ncbi:hypothetical protein TNCT_357251 [Trichonephila clavata]|uniref:Uncharacterized protein n=1 Tax=Trichonephila clavata TaxID=2740835 RepID=A0A8X6LG89_TRICU|nr:hypothetical protein TNCT_357251 [Trichonephila clavata]